MEHRYYYKAKRKDWEKLPEKYWWVYWNAFSGQPSEPIDESTVCQCTGHVDNNKNDICQLPATEVTGL